MAKIAKNGDFSFWYQKTSRWGQKSPFRGDFWSRWPKSLILVILRPKIALKGDFWLFFFFKVKGIGLTAFSAFEKIFRNFEKIFRKIYFSEIFGKFFENFRQKISKIFRSENLPRENFRVGKKCSFCRGRNLFGGNTTPSRLWGVRGSRPFQSLEVAGRRPLVSGRAAAGKIFQNFWKFFSGKLSENFSEKFRRAKIFHFWRFLRKWSKINVPRGHFHVRGRLAGRRPLVSGRAAAGSRKIFNFSRKFRECAKKFRETVKRRAFWWPRKIAFCDFSRKIFHFSRFARISAKNHGQGCYSRVHAPNGHFGEVTLLLKIWLR